MTVLADTRPPGLDLLVRPATTVTVELVWPTGELAGRTFSATLDGDPLGVAALGDALTVEADVAVTGALALGVPVAWLLLEDLGGTEPEPILVGEWTPSNDPQAVSSTTLHVTQGGAVVTVHVTSSQASIVALDARVDALEAPAVVEHDWTVDGWSPFTHQVVSADGPATQTPSVVTGRGRITGQAAATNGNRRDWYLRDDTLWEDSEVCSLWSPSVMADATATPQMGHVHRVKEIAPGVWSGYVVSNNIVFGAFATWNQNIWQTDLAALALGTNGGNKLMSAVIDRQLGVTSLRRFTGFGLWFNDYWVVPHHLWGAAPGDVVSTDVADATFDETTRALNNADVVAGVVQILEPTVAQQVAVAQKFESGFVVPQNHKRWFPTWVKSQLSGTVLRVKVWRYMEPEPDWGQAANVVSFDTAGAGNPAPGATAPTGPGRCGLVAAHLRSGAFMEYGATTFRRL